MFLLMTRDMIVKVYGPRSRATQLISSTFCEHLIEDQRIAIYTNLGIGKQGMRCKGDPIIISTICSIN